MYSKFYDLYAVVAEVAISIRSKRNPSTSLSESACIWTAERRVL